MSDQPPLPAAVPLRNKTPNGGAGRRPRREKMTRGLPSDTGPVPGPPANGRKRAGPGWAGLGWHNPAHLYAMHACHAMHGRPCAPCAMLETALH